MLFQDKPLSVLYFEECLINPPVFPGTQNLTMYMNELRLLSAGGFATKAETSERAGEILGSLASRLVIAVCIIAVRAQSGKKGEIRKLNSAMKSLEGKVGRYSETAWSLNHHPFGGTLDDEKVAIGMGKSLRFLVDSTQPGFVLENELNVGTHLIAFRYEVMRNFPPSYIREKLWEGIKEMTGVSLDNDGLPIK